jgi:predicted DNA-binding ribbon-helix-helix protein
MSNAKTPISKASSYQDIGEYWDAHDLGEVWEQTEVVEASIELGGSVTYYPLEISLSDKLREAARQRGVSAETLLNLWIQEKIRERSA